jgi:undecaprenyl-diphosphatase
MIKKIKDIDLRLFYYGRTHSFSSKTNACLRFYIRLGDGYFWAIVLAYIAVSDDFGKMIWVVKESLPSVLLSLAFYRIIKRAFKRKRPFDLLPDVRADVPPLDKYSFPSGHTMNNLTAGLSLAYFMSHANCFFAVLFFLIPLSWGLLRVYYGVHWLSDVLAGIIFAVLSFYCGQLFV